MLYVLFSLNGKLDAVLTSLRQVYDEDLTVSLVATLNKLLRSKDNNGKVKFLMEFENSNFPFLDPCH
jgi:hypothetical protein